MPMISGPIAPHPRMILHALLESGSQRNAAPTIESGLSLIERDVRVGDDLRVDFLARDAVGTPVLILAFDEEDEAWAPLHIADLQLWFSENAYLLEQAVSDRDTSLGLSWAEGFRILVVTHGVPQRFYRRLELLRGLDLDVYELRSVFVRGETRWLLRGIAPWVVDEEPFLATLPSGLADPELGELASRLLERATSLDEGVELRGDRYERDLRYGGQSLMSLEVRQDGIRARFPLSGEVIALRSDVDVDRVLDRCLRIILSSPHGAARDAAAAPHATEPVRLPLAGPGAASAARYARSPQSPGPRLSDAEVSAFYGGTNDG